jgi:hypothetical protein
MLIRLRQDERGVALIVSLLVMFVVMTLATVVFAQAIHNSTASGYDRKRLQSVDAAEAGLNYYYNYLEHTPAVSLSSSPFSGSIASAPGQATFSVQPTWYSDAVGTLPFTGTFSDTNFPQSVKIVSTGTTNGTTTRRMESFMAIYPTYTGFGGAVVTNSPTSLVNSFTISGNNGNDGDFFVTSGDLSITSGNQTIKGNLYVPNGSLNVGAQVHVYGSVWANNSVTINHPQALVDQDATSSTSFVSVLNGAVGGVGNYCTAVSGTSRIAGGTIKRCQGPPPSPTFPQVTYNDTYVPQPDPRWSGYLYVPFTGVGTTACDAARAYIEGTGAGTYNGGLGLPAGTTGVLVRILSTCAYNPSNNVKINLNSNLAIISNGSINLTQQSTWTGVGTTRNVHLIVPWPQTCSGGIGNITVGNNTNFNALVSVGLYTPCTATMSNQNAFYGQVVGGTVVIGNNWAMNYRPIVIPGAHVGGFTQDIAYIREIA